MLDYTLTGMSVIQPDTDAKVSNDKPPVDISMKTAADIMLSSEHTDEQNSTPNELEDKASSKKRKSNTKSKSRSKKKAKGGVAYTEVAAIPLTS